MYPIFYLLKGDYKPDPVNEQIVLWWVVSDRPSGSKVQGFKVLGFRVAMGLYARRD